MDYSCFFYHVLTTFLLECSGSNTDENIEKQIKNTHTYKYKIQGFPTRECPQKQWLREKLESCPWFSFEWYWLKTVMELLKDCASEYVCVFCFVSAGIIVTFIRKKVKYFFPLRKVLPAILNWEIKNSTSSTFFRSIMVNIIPWNQPTV